MIHIISFLYGDWCNGYKQYYLENLSDGIAKNLTLPYTYKIMCDSKNVSYVKNAGLDYIEFNSNSWRFCLPKMNAHSQEKTGIQNGERVIVIDLDMKINGSLDDMFSYDGDFCTGANFKGLRTGDWIAGGGLQSFKMGVSESLYSWIKNNPRGLEFLTQGRERIAFRKILPATGLKIDFWQDKYPNQYVSYKWDVVGTEEMKPMPIDDARIIAFHGNPRMHEIDTNKNW